MNASPLPFRWEGDAFTPLRPKAADKAFVVGEVYYLVEHQERSWASHAHEFAWLHDAFLNLPEDLAAEFPTETHLRKRALIEAGFYNEMLVDAGTAAAAGRVAHGFRAMDEFAHVVVRGAFVAVRTAKSQSRRAMNKQEFQASKTAIMDIIANMIGVAPEELARNAGQAA